MRRIAAEGVLLSALATAQACARSPYALDDLLRLTDVQAKGTHNSYHLEPKEPLDASHRYSQAPLEVQLEEQGVRQIELDVHLRAGGGFEVFHLPSIDPRSTCPRFVDCLKILKRWSDAHPWHLPVIVWIEPKDEDFDYVDPTLLAVAPHLADLEAEILSIWPLERIYRPDDLRRDRATLPEAVMALGWPTLREVRGRIVFALLDSGTSRSAYTEDAPNLAGRLMFVDASTATDPFAAMFKIDDARSDGALVHDLAESGFLVTTTADETQLSDDENQARLEASLTSGAHFLSSDHPSPAADRAYFLSMPAGGPAECNPLSAVSRCRASDLE